MANTKNKSDIIISNLKKNSIVSKKSNKMVTSNKKNRPVKKKLEVEDEIKKQEVEETELIKKTTTNNNLTSRAVARKNNSVGKKTIKKVELTSEEVAIKRKERNRKKYLNQQKKYQETKKTKEKKNIVIEDRVDVKKKIDDTINEENLVKKVKDEKKKGIVDKEKARKEKRKSNRKSIQFTQTLTNIKEKSVNTINSVKEKANDKNIPTGKTLIEKSKRSKRLIKESIVYSIIMTIIDIICILLIDNYNFLRLFDVKSLNIIITILFALIFNFFVAFMIDYFVTNIWLKVKCKKKAGEQDGDNRIIEEEHKENIQDKE